MIRKISLCLFIIITIGSLVPFLASCGDISDGPYTKCLTNSTVFCGGGGPTVKKRVVSDYIKDECESGISVGNTVSVFGKSWKIINFSRPFNECFTDFDNFTTVTNTNSNSVLFNIESSDLSKINNSEDFLNMYIYIQEGTSSLEIRPYTNLKEFVNEDCWSEIVLGEKVNAGGKEWLALTFPNPFKRCYKSLAYEVISNELINLGSSIGLRIDNVAPTVATVEELLNLTFTESIEGTNL